MRTFFAALSMAVALCACGSPFYMIDPLEATVVDAKTQKPLEGVVVLAHWQIVRGGFDGPKIVGQLEIKETVTDAAGRFRFEGFTALNPTMAELRDADPGVVFFKAGYRLERLASSYPRAGTETPGIRRRSSLNGTVIALREVETLQAVDGTTVLYPSADIQLSEIAKGCGWRRMPLTVAAMYKEHQSVKTSGKGETELLTPERLDSVSGEKCGTAQAFFGEKN